MNQSTPSPHPSPPLGERVSEGRGRFMGMGEQPSDWRTVLHILKTL